MTGRPTSSPLPLLLVFLRGCQCPRERGRQEAHELRGTRVVFGRLQKLLKVTVKLLGLGLGLKGDEVIVKLLGLVFGGLLKLVKVGDDNMTQVRMA